MLEHAAAGNLESVERFGKLMSFGPLRSVPGRPIVFQCATKDFRKIDRKDRQQLILYSTYPDARASRCRS